MTSVSPLGGLPNLKAQPSPEQAEKALQQQLRTELSQAWNLRKELRNTWALIRVFSTETW